MKRIAQKIILSILTTVFTTAFSPLFGQVVVIDAGHGYNANCSNGDGRTATEIDSNWSVSIKLKNLIEANCTWTVHLTRPNNGCGSQVGINDRWLMSNNWNADRILSIHCNAGGGTGTETFWCDISPSSNSSDEAFATEIQARMVQYGVWTDRRVVEDDSYLNYHLGVLRYSNAIGCLNEIGFVDHANDEPKLLSNSWRDEFANAYYVALQNDLNSSCSGNGGGCEPNNDDCVSATSITTNGSCITGTVDCATPSGEPQANCDAYSGTPLLGDVWFSFYADGNGTHTIEIQPDGNTTYNTAYLDPVVEVYASCNLNPIACADDNGGGGGFTDLELNNISPGTPYYIRVYDYGGAAPANGGFEICVTSESSGCPDLVVQSASVDDNTPEPGQIINASLVTLNQGSADSDPDSEVGFYISTDCNWDASDEELSWDPLSTISPNGTENDNDNIEIPSWVQTGQTYYIIFYTDNNDLTDECSNENNNTYCVPITIASPSCTYSFSPNSVSVGANGGSGNITINASNSSCDWSLTASPCISGLSLSDATGTGTQTISYTVPANTTCSEQTCVLGINGSNAQLVITQSGQSTPNEPTGLTPGNTSGSNPEIVTTTSPLLDWSSVSGNNICYWLFLDDLTTGTNIYNGECICSSSQFQLSGLQNGHEYLWYIAAYEGGNCNSTCASDETAWYYFEVQTCTPPTSPTSILPNNPSICGNGSANLSVQGGSLGTDGEWIWYENGCGSGNPVGVNASTFTATPSSTTEYYVRGESSCGNTNCQSVTVTVSQQVTPSVSISSSTGNFGVCEGYPVTFTATPVNGGGNPDYAWSDGGTPVGSNNPTYTTSSLSVGNHSINCTMTSSESCAVPQTVAATSFSITVTPSPSAPSISPSNPPAGCSPVILIATANSGCSYSWNTPNGTVNTGTSNQLTASESGQYSVTVNCNGCGSGSSNTVNVTINNNISASFSGLGTTYCTGDAPVSLSGNPSGGTFSGNGINGSTFYPSTAGTGTHVITYTYDDANGCSDTHQQQVTINSEPGIPGSINGATSFCTGTAETYSINSVIGATSYTWSYSGIGNITGSGTAITLTATSSGTLSVTANNSCGSSPPQTRSIIINQIPATPSISPSNPPAGCSPVALLATTNSGCSYSWSTPSGTINTNTSNELTASESGQYSVTVNCNGCESGSSNVVDVTINNNISASFSGLGTTYCTGDAPVTLSGTPSGGTFSGNGINGSTFYPSTAGTGIHVITYTYDDGNGCSDTYQQQVTVNPEPIVPTVAVSNNPICPGESTELSVTNTSACIGCSYSWSPSSWLSTTTGEVVISTPATNAAYTVTVLNSCGTESALTGTITVSNTPATPVISPANPSASCNPIELTATSCSGCTYSWSTPNGPQNTGTDNELTAGVNGTYSVVITSANGCESATSNNVVVTLSGPQVSFSGLNATYCEGDGFVVLTGSPSGGTFNGNGVYGTVFYPDSAGVGSHTISYEYNDGNGCSGLSEQQITVGGLPTANAGLDAVISPGGTTTLNGTGGITCFWSPGLGLNNPNNCMPLASPNLTTVYTLTVTDGNGCTDTDEVEVAVECNISTTPDTASYTEVSGGGSINITAPSGCSWSAVSGCPWVTIINGSGSGNGTVTYSVAANIGIDRYCDIDIDGETVTVFQTGAIQCDNSTVSINPSLIQIPEQGGSGSVAVDFTPQTTNCTWIVDAGDCTWISNLQPNTAQTISGTVSFDVGENTSGAPRSCTLQIITGTGSWGVVIEQPTTGAPSAFFIPQPACGVAPLSVGFQDQSIGNPTSWDWFFNGATPFESTSQHPQGVVYSQPGEYTVSLTVSNAAGSSTTQYQYICVVSDISECDNCNYVGVDDEEFQFGLNPNPTSDYFQLVLRESLKEGGYQVFNNLGQLVVKGNIVSNQTRIDMSGFAKGVYTVWLMEGEAMLGTKRLVLLQN